MSCFFHHHWWKWWLHNMLHNCGICSQIVLLPLFLYHRVMDFYVSTSMQFVFPQKVAAFHRYQRMKVSIVDLLLPHHFPWFCSTLYQECLNPGEYLQKVESVRVPKNCPDQYGKMVESVWVPKNCWIRASTDKRWNPCEYRKIVQTSTKKW